MARVKVVVTDYIEDDLEWEARELAKAGIDFEAYQLKFKPEDEVLEKISDADIIVVNMALITESILSRLSTCRLLIRHGIGYDNVDVDACTKHGIVFAYQPSYCKVEVAEHAIALILACARKIPRSRKTLEEASARGAWDFSDLFPIYRLEGKALGILGVGRVGSLVARKLSTFGMKIIAHDPYLSDKRRAELDIEWVDKETLFRTADFLTIHTPLNDETRHIVTAESLNWMKPTACLINTSRGPMVDVDALAAALRKDRIAGAAVDVYDKEPPSPDYPLFGIESAILTPHIAWASEESGWDIRRSILSDILAAAQGKPARHIVNKEVLEGKKS